MSDTYSSETLKKLGKLGELARQSLEAFQRFDRQAFAEGALRVKVKELVAVAAAMNAGASLAHGAIAVDSLEH